MTPYYDHAGITIYHGDCREILPTLAADSVDCCVTSPPYWGLRDYGTAAWIDGSAECDHVNPRGNQGATGQRVHRTHTQNLIYQNECGKCGARRLDRQIGLETTPEDYTGQIADVFREVRRILRPDGTAWLNLGDSYAAGGKGGGGSYMAERKDAAWQKRSTLNGWKSAPPGLKEKDLVGIPWRVAFALQRDGWYLRSDIIWSKPNPMPESVTDRPTKAHEYLFLLAREERYYYDAEAIAETAINGELFHGAYSDKTILHQTAQRNGRTRPSVPRGGFNGKTEALAAQGRNAFRAIANTRNRRSVWEIPTQPTPEAHFATFPEALVEPCIKAGSPAGGLILDPFGGAGTVALVAKRLSSRAILIELNESYCEIAARRLEQDVFDFPATTTTTTKQNLELFA